MASSLPLPPPPPDGALDRARRVIERELPRSADALAALAAPSLEDADVAATVEGLASPAAAEALAANPYWPKWDGPWWRLLLLHELGLSAAAPGAVLDALARSVDLNCVHGFPLTQAELPAGLDPVLGVMCHCAMGGLGRLLRAGGRELERELPWAQSWFLRYQLPDGGLNCDEAAYTRPTPRSSFLSTLPPLEHVLAGWDGASAPERDFLERGARYLLDRRLLRSISRGYAPADPAWLEPVFPRFYDYDVLRGLEHVTRWAERVAAPLPAPAVVEALEALADRLTPAGALGPGRCDLADAFNKARGPDGVWSRAAAQLPPLLLRVSRPGTPSQPLTARWVETLTRLRALDERGLLRGGPGQAGSRSGAWRPRPRRAPAAR